VDIFGFTSSGGLSEKLEKPPVLCFLVETRVEGPSEKSLELDFFLFLSTERDLSRLIPRCLLSIFIIINSVVKS
jgi:hypothetical protein